MRARRRAEARPGSNLPRRRPFACTQRSSWFSRTLSADQRLRHAGGQLVEGEDLVQRWVRHDARHQRRSAWRGRRVRRSRGPAAAGPAAPGRRSGPAPCAGSIRRRARRPSGFITPSRCEAHRVFERRPANQPHVAHLVQVRFPAEGARKGNLRSVPLRRHFQLDAIAGPPAPGNPYRTSAGSCPPAGC